MPREERTQPKAERTQPKVERTRPKVERTRPKVERACARARAVVVRRRPSSSSSSAVAHGTALSACRLCCCGPLRPSARERFYNCASLLGCPGSAVEQALFGNGGSCGSPKLLHHRHRPRPCRPQAFRLERPPRADRQPPERRVHAGASHAQPLPPRRGIFSVEPQRWE